MANTSYVIMTGSCRKGVEWNISEMLYGHWCNSTQTVLWEQIVYQANLSIFPPRIGMISLTGHGLNIIGESNVCLSYEGLRHETAVLIASDLSGDACSVA